LAEQLLQHVADGHQLVGDEAFDYWLARSQKLMRDTAAVLAAPSTDQLAAFAETAATIYTGFETESLNGVVCSIPDTGLDTPPHRTWCARCQTRYKRLAKLAEDLAALREAAGVPTGDVQFSSEKTGRRASVPSREPLDALADKTARELWAVITEDCFGMTPDPWVCDDESDGTGCQTEGHWCLRHRERVARFLLAALRAAASVERPSGGSEVSHFDKK
jgi:hypothetical protein